MQPLFQSAFLQALGFAIANSLWQTALVWLLYISITHVIPLSSAARYRVAVVAQLVSFCWFAITIQFYYGQYTQVLTHAPGSETLQAIMAGNNGFSSQLIRYIVKIERLLPYVSLAYLLLMLILGLRWLGGYRQTQLMRSNGTSKIDVQWRMFVKRTASQLGIKKEVLVFLSEKISTPLTIGFLKPVILVPLASINHLTTDQLEAVLLHELAHVKRYDYLVNIILSVVEISLFFNPFTQLISRHIRKERENSCDDWVLQFQYEASDYAEALLRIACLQNTPALAMAATGAKNELLLNRVKRMIGQHENRFSYRRQLLAFALVTGMLGCIAWLNPVTATHKTTESKQSTALQKNTRRVTIEPMAMKVTNPLFNPVFFLSTSVKAVENNTETIHQYAPEATHPESINTLTPVIAAALDQAANELAKLQDKDWSKELAGMEQAKHSLEQLARDSVNIPAMLRPALNQELGRSMESIARDIDKAKAEISNIGRTKKKMMFDQERVKQDVAQAMREMNRIDLDQLIDHSFSEAGTTLKKNAERQNTRKQKAEKQNPPPPVNEIDEPAVNMESIEVPQHPSPQFSRAAFEKIVLTPEVIAELKNLVTIIDELSQQPIDPETEQRLKVKLAIIQNVLGKKVKMIPALLRLKPSGDSIYMRMQ